MLNSDDPQAQFDQPQAEHIFSLLNNFQPRPRQGFNHRMQQAPWNREGKQFFIKVVQSLRTFPVNAFAVFVIFLILTLLFFTPSLVSTARQIFQFFGVHDENSRSIEVTSTPISPSDTSLSEFKFSLSLAEAAKAANFPIKVPVDFPKGTVLEGAAYDETRQAVLIKYIGKGKTFLFTQRDESSVSEYASIGSSAPAELVTVRGVQGEFVTGGWVIQSLSENQSGAQTINLVWENQAGMWTLRWEENGFVYEIVAASSQSVSLTEILAIAESMR